MTALPGQISPTRPALRYHGGKWRLAPWIVAQMPPHRVYVEPFGGAASVLLRKPRVYAEVYNDLDDELVNFFRVLRNEDLAERLVRQLALTPFARAEMDLAYAAADDPVERARRLCALAFMGFGSTGAMLAGGDPRGRTTGFRANCIRQGKHPASDWAGYPDALRLVVDRLRGVVIEHRPAADIIAAHDDPETLFYVDPPYVADTRNRKNKHDRRYHCYRHELTDDGHAALIDQLRDLRGMVMLSGYAHPLYDDALRDWTRLERQVFADGARPRSEILWINAHAVDVLAQSSLFASKVPA